MNTSKKKPTLLQALIPIVFMIVALAIGYGFLNIKAEPIMIASAFIAGIIALKLGYTWDEMQKSIVDKIANALPATLIIFLHYLSSNFHANFYIYHLFFKT